jgi:hypothetical protein
VNAAVDNGTGCDNGDFCTPVDTCLAGICQNGFARDCDDNNPCTIDNCSEAARQCTHTNVSAGQFCPDGALCDGATCDGNGTCVAGTAVSCLPPQSCNPANGQCQPP